MWKPLEPEATCEQHLPMLQWLHHLQMPATMQQAGKSKKQKAKKKKTAKFYPVMTATCANVCPPWLQDHILQRTFRTLATRNVQIERPPEPQATTAQPLSARWRLHHVQTAKQPTLPEAAHNQTGRLVMILPNPWGSATRTNGIATIVITMVTSIFQF